MSASNRNSNSRRSRSVTRRLSNNLSSYNPLSRKGRSKVSSRSPSQFSRNTSNLRRSLLKPKKNNKNKLSKLTTQYQYSNKYRYPKLKSILRSHRNNLQKFIYNEDKRSRNERAEALKEAYEAPAYLSLAGERFEIEPSDRQMAERLKAVDYYYPERQRTTYEQSKRGGPKGTAKAIRKIRRGLNKTTNKRQKQKLLSYVGLPNNINNYYFRGNNVPQMVKNSHIASNRQIYGNNMEMQGYYKYKPEVLTPTRKPSRFTVTFPENY